jgi:hypothetical protein
MNAGAGAPPAGAPWLQAKRLYLCFCGLHRTLLTAENERGRQRRRPSVAGQGYEEDRGRLVDVLGYGKRIERNFSGSAACHRRQFGLAQRSRGDGSSFAVGGRFDEIGQLFTSCCSTVGTIQSSMRRRLGGGWPTYRDPGHAPKTGHCEFQLRPPGEQTGRQRPRVRSASYRRPRALPVEPCLRHGPDQRASTRFR